MFGKNLVYLRKAHNWTQAELADRLDIARTTLGDYEREKTEPNFEMLTQLADLFNIDIDALITRAVYQEGVNIQPSSEQVKRYVDPSSEYLQAIDLVETKAEAGYLESFQDPEYIRDLPKLYLPYLPKNEYRGFEIEGDSMLPMESGSVIIGVKVESLEALRNQRTYIIITKREGMVYKRIQKNLAGNFLTAISDNPLFPAYDIDYDSIAEIWQYYAHLGFSDQSPESYLGGMVDRDMSERIGDIQQKVTEIYDRTTT
ncbi:LexA family transcriptional regulator [Membranicola marinus]|uniref:LexA family transcriptional regulator n=1 Tax=Membranihabitans marinus TaxID=1227546 RepID=A0A953HUF4_9BACT|nr:LexA family transcriptional regulator [Membranihabitans marinus]MBY5958510.1 LexA family transcriptional regulator [Membranihabitans marinus]